MVFSLFREENKNEEKASPVKNQIISLESSFPKVKPLIVHCCHHKTGTVVMDKIFRAISSQFGLKYQYCPQSNLESDTDIWLDDHSHIDFSRIDRPIKGTHMIRNPCAIIVSAYEYHKQTNEPWANRKLKAMKNVSYKDVLNSLDFEKGMEFEMKNAYYVESSKNTIADIYNWDYRLPNFLELKYEDLMTNYNGTIANMFKHYGFSRNMIDAGVEIAAKFNLRNRPPSDLENNLHITNKNLDLDKWKEYFSNKFISEVFIKNYPDDLFEKIGYITDNLESVSNVKVVNNFGARYKHNDKIWKKYNGENMFVIA